MKAAGLRFLTVMVLMLPMGWAQAAITCTVSSPGFSTTYQPADVTPTVVQSSVTVTCQRNNFGDPGSLDYSVGVDNGLYVSGGSNRANFGASFVQYNTYGNSACTSSWQAFPRWRRVPVPPPGTLALSGFTPSTANINVWICIPAAQAGVASGTHLDTVTMTLFQGTSNTSLATGTFPVSILVSPTCSVTTTPGAIVLNYTSLGPAVNANTTFGVTCTNSVSYTMAFDPLGGTLLGLSYSLALSPASGGTGSGVEQTYTITGSMAAGQSGTCATALCPATEARTLTITY